MARCMAAGCTSLLPDDSRDGAVLPGLLGQDLLDPVVNSRGGSGSQDCRQGAGL